MNIFALEKIILILIIFYHEIYSDDDCLMYSLNDYRFPKAQTLENGYHLVISNKGINSFYPGLSSMSSTFTFNEEQVFSIDTFKYNNTINQVEISQFSNEEGGKNYVICFAKNYIYFMNEKGTIFFNQELPITIYIDYPITLAAYKYINNNYFFIIGHISLDISTNVKFFYYKINKDDVEGQKLLLENQFEITYDTYYVVRSVISCQIMISTKNGKILICFFNLKKDDISYIVASSFNPEESFEKINDSNYFPEPDNKELKSIKCSINYNKTKSLACYSIESPDKIKCVSYDVNENVINSTSLIIQSCGTKKFHFNIYYFEKSNEYIFSCLNVGLDSFYIHRVDTNFNIINDDNVINKTKFSNCYTYNYLSIIYVSKYKQYSALIDGTCDGGNFIRIFSFVTKQSTCITPTGENEGEDNDEEDVKDNLKTTIVQKKSTTLHSTNIDTTIYKTISKTTILIASIKSSDIQYSSIASSNFFSTLPSSNIKNNSTSLNIKTDNISSIIKMNSTIPNIKTTSFATSFPNTSNIKIYSTIPKSKSTSFTTFYPNTSNIKIYSTIPNSKTSSFTTSFPNSSIIKIDSTLLNIKATSFATSFPNNIISTSPNKTIVKTEKVISTIISEKSINIPIEKLCNDENKIYTEGKCQCDKNKGYYSINSQNLDDKCIHKNENPKYLYFNNVTEVFELCYETCETCIKGGNFSENNCLTCASNYVKEKDRNTTNCVDSCKYLFYYDTMDQYSCTEDEQCPSEASLIIRPKGKCINKCYNDLNYRYQYNGECLLSCPSNTEANKNNICQINDTLTCSISDFKLNLEEVIGQDNVKLVAINYANEFSYTQNHVSRFTGLNYKMVLYKNSQCIDELKLNITKIQFDSCIQKLKTDNNINEYENLIVAVVDILSGSNPITTFGFFHPVTGEKLDATKSCSEENVIMYEDIFSILKDPLAIKLLEEQKINIFDLNSDFYNDICFHFESPNGKDATLQDRIKSFYPNITLCDAGCKNKGINLTTMEAECECTFYDLLSKNIFDNDLIGDNVLVKETIEGIIEMLTNLNIEILTCYKDVFDYNYFKKNAGGFIVMSLFVIYTIFILYFYFITKDKIIRYIYSLTEKYIKHIIQDDKTNKVNISVFKKNKTIKNPPKKKISKRKSKRKFKPKDKNKMNKKNNKEEKENKGKNKQNICLIDIKVLNLKTLKSSKSSKLLNQKSKKFSLYKNKGESKLNKLIKKRKTYKINAKRNFNKSENSLVKSDFNFLKENIDIEKFLEPSFETMDYDDVVEEDKRTFCQYFSEKITDNQIIINSFFIEEYTKPRSIKIPLFILGVDSIFLTNALFYSDSTISEIYNSTEQETALTFMSRSIDRFIYTNIIVNITNYFINFFFVKETKIRKILLKKKNDILSLRYEMAEILQSIFKRIKILIFLNYILLILSWYYLSCFNNVYPNLRNEWIISSLIIIFIFQVLPFIFTFIETCIRFMSIKYESEKLFRLSLLLSC